MIRITCKREGFRRCGIAHHTSPTDHPDDQFSKEELEILKAESMLTVELVEGEVETDKKEPKDMTVAGLMEELKGHQEFVPSGLKKAEYVEMVQAHRDKGNA